MVRRQKKVRNTDTVEGMGGTIPYEHQKPEGTSLQAYHGTRSARRVRMKGMKAS